MSFRFIHTADWHLGRTLHGASLIADQEWVLQRLLDLVAQDRPDAVVVAGDVYDRAVPSRDAVALLDRVLCRLVLDLSVPVLLVAGNHDSPERLGFVSGLLEEAGLHVAGRPAAQPRSVLLGEGADATRFWLLPYADPITSREALGAEDIHDHEAAVAGFLAGVSRAPGERHVLVTHHFVAGGIPSESERGLTVGGTGAVPVDLFAGFDYVALGHLHRPQSMGRAGVRYAGSLLKYSFAEANHEKSVTMVELDGDAVRVEERPLGAWRDVRRIEGFFDDVIAAAPGDPRSDDYLEITLLDRGPVHDAMGRLRTVYPNTLLAARRLDLALPPGGPNGAGEGRALQDDELFERFFLEVTGDDLDPGQLEVLQELLSDYDRAEREAEA